MEMRRYRPKNFTEEPHQDPEHMHTVLIKDIPALEEIYIHVSDDEGVVLGDLKLEEKAKEYYNLLPHILKGEVEGPELKEVQDVAIMYHKRINKILAIKSGTITKYRIRQGSQFIILKILVKNSGQLWEAWFRENFKEVITIRLAQLCMQLARIPNIIRYSVFGMPRLLEIIRAIDQNDSDDPVGNFLRMHSILFDPEIEPDIEGDKIEVDKVKIQIDVILAFRKIEEAGLNSINERTVKTLVTTVNNFRLTKQLLKRLGDIQEDGGNPNEYLHTLSLNGGLEPHTYNAGLQPHLDRVGAEWLDIVEKCLNEPERLRTIDFRIINKIWEIASKIREMEAPLGK